LYSNRLKKSEWEVRDIPIAEARPIVEKYHYARGAANTATELHGLYRRGEWLGAPCYGVAWWIPPTRSAAAAWWPDPDEVLVLSRLVIIPGTPKNAATFLLMRSVKMLDPRWKCLLTYADTWQGHTGHIYRAAGWEYLGMTAPERIYQLNGRMVSRKAGPRTRTHDEMIRLGAQMIGSYAKHRFRLIRSPNVTKKEVIEINEPCTV
jgi:hypothetical protein